MIIYQDFSQCCVYSRGLKHFEVNLFHCFDLEHPQTLFVCLFTLCYTTLELLTFVLQSPGWGQGVNSQISSEDSPHT